MFGQAAPINLRIRFLLPREVAPACRTTGHMQVVDQGQGMVPNLGMVMPDYGAIQRGSGECSTAQLAVACRTTPL